MDFAALEFDLAVLEGEEGVIRADADVEAGHEFRAALADDDGAGRDDLPAIRLDATILRIAVASVPGGALTLLMCHTSPVISKKPRWMRGRECTGNRDGNQPAGDLTVINR